MQTCYVMCNVSLSRLPEVCAEAEGTRIGWDGALNSIDRGNTGDCDIDIDTDVL